MSATVAKAFKSAQCKFLPGAPVSPADDLSPHDYTDLVKRGFIVEAKAEPSPKSGRRTT